jgi:acyl-[acyl-carrier-protein]-phospholipid O-acyltransferase/long-chain-fatty-acid--[acyl-carrier-protein] ligase
MQKLWRQPGFARLNAVSFLNAWVALGHIITVQNTIFAVYDGPPQVALTGLVSMIVLLPYVFMMGPAGRWSDTLPKGRVLEVAAGIGIGLLALITLSYALGWFWLALGLTLPLAIQTAVFAPARFGYLREGVPTDLLTRGNGVLQAVIVVSMLFTMFVHSLLFDLQRAGRTTADPGEIIAWMTPIGGLLLTVMLVEWWIARPMAGLGQGAASERIAVSGMAIVREGMGRLFGDPVILGCTLGLSAFWALAQGLIAIYPSWAEDTLGVVYVTQVQMTVASAGIGVVIGSMLAPRFALPGRVPTGLVPVGAAGVALCLAGLPLVTTPVGQILLFIGLGTFGGLLVVPLETLIQLHAVPARLGLTLAASNVIRNLVMIGLLVATIGSATLGLDAGWLLGALMVIAAVGLVAALRALPHALITLLLELAFSARYRVSVLGHDLVPKQGGVLLLGNHVSYIDWAMVWLACPRPVRFVMSRSLYRRWYWQWVLKLSRVLPISPMGAHGSMRLIADSLARGEVVCVFPEGTLTRHGQLNPLRPGFQRTLDLLPPDAEVQVVPFFLRGLWGSRFSKAKRPRACRLGGWRRSVVVAFGAPLPRTVRTRELKPILVELSRDAWQAHAEALPTLALAALRALARRPGRLAVIDPTIGVELTNGRLAAGALCLMRALAQSGPLRGERIGVLLPAGAGALLVDLAVLLGGGKVVNLNYTWSAAQVADAVERAGVRRVVSSERFAARMQQRRSFDVAAAAGTAELVMVEALRARIRPWQGPLALLKLLLLPGRLIVAATGAELRDNQAEAALLFSSGSEGRPKGIALSHAALYANIEQSMQLLDPTDEDRLLACLPPFHAFGLTVCCLLPILEGLTVVTVADPTRALDLARVVARHRASILFSTPTLLRLLLRHPRLHPLLLAPLRLVVAGAERLDETTRMAFLDRFHKPILEGYGCTETGPVACCNVPDLLEPDAVTTHLGWRPGTVGLPVPGTAIRIVDRESGVERPVGEPGEVVISGPQLMLGYLDEPALTARAFLEQDGRRWYRTGDQGRLDADGFLTIVDRYSRFAKVAGEMVSLTRLEGLVRELLQQDIPTADAVAVSLPDPLRGERIVVLVSGMETLPDLADLRHRMLAADCPALALPDGWHVIPELPRLGSGKTDVQAARRMAATLEEPAAKAAAN